MTARKVLATQDREHEATIRRILFERGMTYEDLGKKAGITKNAISAILNGADARLSTFRKIARALDLDLATLFTPLPEVAPTKSHPHHTPTQDEIGDTLKNVMMEAIANVLLKGGQK